MFIVSWTGSESLGELTLEYVSFVGRSLWFYNYKIIQKGIIIYYKQKEFIPLLYDEKNY